MSTDFTASWPRLTSPGTPSAQTKQLTPLTSPLDQPPRTIYPHALHFPRNQACQDAGMFFTICHVEFKFDHGIAKAFPINMPSVNNFIFFQCCYNVSIPTLEHWLAADVALYLQLCANHILGLDDIPLFTLSWAIYISLCWTNGLSANIPFVIGFSSPWDFFDHFSKFAAALQILSGIFSATLLTLTWKLDFSSLSSITCNRCIAPTISFSLHTDSLRNITQHITTAIKANQTSSPSIHPGWQTSPLLLPCGSFSLGSIDHTLCPVTAQS